MMQSNQSKRPALSPAEAEKTKKVDDKVTPISPKTGISGMLSFMRGKSNSGASADPLTFAAALNSGSQDDVHMATLPLSRTRGKPVFEVRNEGSMREEIEVEIESLNGGDWTGTISPQEAKSQIYKHCLGFDDLKNFDGVRISFKGKLVLTFKLKTAVDVDDFIDIQFFNYTRTGTRRGKPFEDVIGCKIRGICPKQTVKNSFAATDIAEGNTVVSIEGCEYRVSEDTILSWLSLYGEVKSEMVEDLFLDDPNEENQDESEEESGGMNRTGNYSVLMKLDQSIPQLLPMSGRRIKIYYRGVRRLCTNCFGKHQKRECGNEKVPWIDYVSNFRSHNQDIPDEFFGRWIDILQKNLKPNENQAKQLETENFVSVQSNLDILSNPAHQNSINPIPNKETVEQSPEDDPALDLPKPEDFNIPGTLEEMEETIEKMMALGMTHTIAKKTMDDRTTAFNRALRQHGKNQAKKTDQRQPYTTRSNIRNSLTQH